REQLLRELNPRGEVGATRVADGETDERVGEAPVVSRRLAQRPGIPPGGAGLRMRIASCSDDRGTERQLERTLQCLTIAARRCAAEQGEPSPEIDDRLLVC